MASSINAFVYPPKYLSGQVFFAAGVPGIPKYDSDSARADEWLHDEESLKCLVDIARRSCLVNL